MPKLSPLARELVLHLYEQQRRFACGEWDFAGTIWSRATFAVARDNGKLRSSPAHGRHNMERKFEERVLGIRSRLMKAGLARWRSVRPPEAPARFAEGYKRHKSRTRDVFLTEDGLLAAEALLRGAGLLAEQGGPVACDAAAEPKGPVARGVGGCEDA